VRLVGTGCYTPYIRGDAMAEGEEGVMRIGRRCYVSNLAWRTSEPPLRALERAGVW
jgi:hypothetical protein